MVSTLACSPFNSLSGTCFFFTSFFLLLDVAHLVDDSSCFQSLLEKNWKVHGEPALELLTQKVGVFAAHVYPIYDVLPFRYMNTPPHFFFF